MLALLAAITLGYYGEPPAVELFPKAYTASYGPYSASISVNDPLMRPDFDNSKCGQNCWGTSGYNHYERAFQRARDVEDGQRGAFWDE